MSSEANRYRLRHWLNSSFWDLFLSEINVVQRIEEKVIKGFGRCPFTSSVIELTGKETGSAWHAMCDVVLDDVQSLSLDQEKRDAHTCNGVSGRAYSGRSVSCQ